MTALVVEFTAQGGPRAGERVRMVCPDRRFVDWYVTKYLPDAVARTVTCSEREPL